MGTRTAPWITPAAKFEVGYEAGAAVGEVEGGPRTLRVIDCVVDAVYTCHGAYAQIGGTDWRCNSGYGIDLVELWSVGDAGNREGTEVKDESVEGYVEISVCAEDGLVVEVEGARRSSCCRGQRG